VRIAIVAATRMPGHRATQSDDSGRLRMLDRFLTYTKGKQDIWFARKDEIAGLVLSGRAATPILRRGLPTVIGVTWRSGKLSTLATQQSVANQWGDQHRAFVLGLAAGGDESATESRGARALAYFIFPRRVTPRSTHHVHDTSDRFVNITNAEQRAQID
jgi:hypothetical protein